MTILKRPMLLTYLLIGGVFIADLLIPGEGNIVVLYLLAIILGILFKEKSDVFFIGMATTVLTITAVFLEPPSEAIDILLMNRFLGIAGIWGATYLVVRIHNIQEERNRQVEQFKALFKYASNGILIVSAKGVIEMANHAAEKLFGYEQGEMPGKKIEQLVPERLRRQHERHRNDFRADPRPRSMGTGLNLFAVRKDGSEFPVEISLSPFKTDRGEFIVAFVVDNTLRNENEQRIVRQNQTLEQLAGALQSLNENLEVRINDRTKALEIAKNELAQALDKEKELGELKSRFVSMASHEFRTPLSTIQSSAALIGSYADRDDVPNIKKHALRIKNSVNALTTILTEFLSLGKIEEGKTEPNFKTICLPEAVNEVESELKGLFKKGQSITYRHTGSENAYLDPALLKHILYNLVSNAMKYSPEDAKILIESAVSEDGIRLQVKDEGMGIPPADQKHLFTRFFRATNAGNIQGTGLGLYIVKRYVELLNGTIDFASEEGKGSTFFIHLQPAPEDADQVKSPDT